MCINDVNVLVLNRVAPIVMVLFVALERSVVRFLIQKMGCADILSVASRSAAKKIRRFFFVL